MIMVMVAVDVAAAGLFLIFAAILIDGRIWAMNTGTHCTRQRRGPATWRARRRYAGTHALIEPVAERRPMVVTPPAAAEPGMPSVSLTWFVPPAVAA